MKYICIFACLIIGQMLCSGSLAKQQFNLENESNRLLIEYASREVDLTERYVTSISKLKILNQSQQPATSFYYAAPTSQYENTILVVVRLTNSPEKHILGEVVESLEATERNATILKFDLPQSIAAGETILITVEESFMNRQVPYPKEILVTEDQRILFTDSAYIFSLYTVSTQQTIFKAKQILSFTEEAKASKHRNIGIKYGPYTSISEFGVSEIEIHCENNSPLIQFTKAIKTIQVSHWGNIEVDGHYKLVNKGASMKGEFSRIDVNKYSPHGKNAMKQLSAELPYHSTGVWYRDVIGNISTSNAKRDFQDKVVKLNIQPRFPVFGGWKSDLSLGYNLNTTQYVESDNNGGYVLKQLFSFPFLDLLAEEFELKVILPEGATDIKAELPFSVDSQSVSLTQNYLDTNGSPTIIFTKKNVIDFHNQYFKIHYKLSATSVSRKPVILFLAFFALFAVMILLNRIELKGLRAKKDD